MKRSTFATIGISNLAIFIALSVMFITVPTLTNETMFELSVRHWQDGVVTKLLTLSMLVMILVPLILACLCWKNYRSNISPSF